MDDMTVNHAVDDNGEPIITLDVIGWRDRDHPEHETLTMTADDASRLASSLIAHCAGADTLAARWRRRNR